MQGGLENAKGNPAVEYAAKIDVIGSAADGAKANLLKKVLIGEQTAKKPSEATEEDEKTK